ncbi:hypothetical protein [Haloarcula sediminis]|uniref:hypothetical protein n=1 Tax=Haloarcula sediminis TaxID=3111777 RepID=UPI002D798701|nr:hypothetical protein [Haloarcula sp. CK38]
MASSYFDFFGEFTLEVRGDGGRSTSQFREMYATFRTDRCPDPDMVVERTTEAPDPDVVLGDPTDHYGWTGDQFVVRKGSDFMLVDPGWDHLYVSPHWEPFYAMYPVEFAIRSRMVEQDRALVHASGVELDGHTTLFPAWRGAGKTNTLLSLLRAGGNYLADDRLWVGADGEALGFPLAVNLQPHNVDSFPEIELGDDGPRDRMRAAVSRYITEELATGSSVFDRGLRFLDAKFLEDSGRSFVHLDALFRDTAQRARAGVDAVVVLRAAPTADSVTVEPMAADRALSALRAVNYYEWNHRLEESFAAYDSLVPGGSALDRFHRVVDREERILTDLLRSTDTYVATIPRESDWGERGIDTGLVEQIRALRHDRPLQGAS